MPPRFVYWTIIAGGLPTAFRAAEREELLPTFRRIQEKHPDAVMKYFARGKLWESPEAAKQAIDTRRSRAPRDSGARGRDWRPGGEHRDPRQPFKDAKKKRNLDWRKERFERRQGAAPAPPREKPHGDPLREAAARRPRHDRKPGGPPQDRKQAGERPWRPSGPPRDRKPGGPARDRRFDHPPRERQVGGPPRDPKETGTRPWRPKGPPRDRKPGGPRRDFKPGGPPRDRRRRG
jgi:hypothetical protein